MPSNIGPQSAIFRPSRAQGASVLLAWPSFELEIERSLGLLRRFRLPVSLFAVRLAIGSRNEQAVADALAGLGVVGRLPDGALGLFYLGPRGSGPRGDAALLEMVRRRAAQALAGQTEAPRVAAVHGWTDDGTGAALLASMLAASWTPRGVTLGGTMPGVWGRLRVAQPA